MFRKVYVPRCIMVPFILGCVWLLSSMPIALAVSGVQPPSVIPHFQHYLALGDSLAYGLQPSTLSTGDHAHGYVDDFFAFLQMRKFVTDHVDLGCPSETTSSFIAGGLCHYPPPFRSQLTATMGYLQQIHAGDVSFATLDIGVTDIISDIQFNSQTRTCSMNAANFYTHLQVLDTNLKNTILPQLHAVLKAQKNLIVLNSYSPFQKVCPNMTVFIKILNNHLANDVKGFGVLADIFTAFGGVSNVCLYTGMCDINLNPMTVQLDIHPTTLGYQVIAHAVEVAFLQK
jgi:lysophospholipase L1-like esterase